VVRGEVTLVNGGRNGVYTVLSSSEEILHQRVNEYTTSMHLNDI